MTVHLDTSFLIRALAAGSAEDRRLRQWIREGVTLGASAIAWTEFLCGPVEDQDLELAKKLLGDPVAFGETESGGAARLFNETGRRRGSLMDCMIAASAIAAGASLATSDVAGFRRFERAGLTLVKSGRE